MMDKAHYLIVDDDECTRNFLAAVFAHEACVTTACDGREALTLLNQHQYDVVISDVQMPHVDGMELFRQLREMAPRSADQFVLCTGNVTEEVTSFCLNYSIPLCAKPMMVEDIKSVVDKINCCKKTSIK